MLSEHKLLIATDVPFWNRSTGAEQRIAALVEFLGRKSISVRIFFVAKMEECDRKRIESQELDVVQGSSDQPPSGQFKKARWHFQATLFRGSQWIKQLGPPDKPGPLTLEDYRWPWAVDQFSDCVNAFQPNSILIEYVSLAYLLSGLKPVARSKVLCLVDTHDVLHIRNQQFHDRGYAHWLSITRDEEAGALQLFDVILAIEQSEADVFRELAPAAKTILVGHSLEQQSREICPRKPGPAFVVGYIGSRNHSNLFAITSFINAAMTGPLFADSSPVEFHVAGDICQWCAEELGELLPALPNVRLVGRVENLSEFYSSIDVAINPVEFGTGLKIKSCEALAYGCLLLTTPAGKQGLPGGLQRFVVIVESQQEMVDKIRELAHNRDELRRLRSQVYEQAKVLLSDDSAYSDLYETLISSKPNQIC